MLVKTATFLEIAADIAIEAGAHRQIDDHGALARILSPFADAGITFGLGSVHTAIIEPGQKALEHRAIQLLGIDVLLERRLHARPEALEVHLLSSRTEQPRALGQEVFPVELIQRGVQLALRQVAQRAEQHEIDLRSDGIGGPRRPGPRVLTHVRPHLVNLPKY